jgi:pimeloyl-ACP methyl ester carboxylesterase
VTETPDYPQPRDLTILGRRIHVWTGGAGPALLLLHSAWGDAEMSWAPVWNELSRSFTVIAPDMPGFALSDPPLKSSLSESVRLLNGLLEDLAFNNAVIVGNSFGVAVAIEFASAFPEHTRGLVAVNGGYLPVIPSFIKKIISLPVMEMRFRRIMRKIWSEKAFVKAFPNPNGLPVGFFDLLRGYEEKHSRNVYDIFMNQILPQAKPTTPATVIWGTGDGLMSMKQAEALRKWLGNPAFVALEGAGHMPQLELPRKFIEAVHTFSQDLGDLRSEP